MNELKGSRITAESLENLKGPIILCTDTPRMVRLIESAGYKELSLNKVLAEALLKYPGEERIYKVTEEVMSIINKQDKILLTDFEMLFNPGYKMDVVGLLYQISRVKKLAVKWPGKYLSKKLIYAEEGDCDYKVFNAEVYVINCIV